MIRKPESEWISHEGAHEAIIGPELWEAVQKINQAAKQISANNTPPQASLVYRKAGLRGTAGILWLPPAKHSAGKMALSSTILLISAPGLPLPDIASAPGTGFLRSA